MKLQEISASDALVRGVVMAMIEAAPILGDLEFVPSVSQGYAYKSLGQAVTVRFRDKDNDYSGDDAGGEAEATATIRLMGSPVTIDKLDIATHLDIAALKASRMGRRARKLGKEIAKKIFNGSGAGTPTEITGMVNLVDAAYEEALATNGLDLNTAGNERTLFKILDKWIADIDPESIGLNPTFFAWMTDQAREKHGLAWTRDDFGKPVAWYNGLPLRSITGDGIPQTETQGTSTDCTSLYLIRPGEGDSVTFPTIEGVQVEDFKRVGNSPIHEGNIELYTEPVLYETDALVRIKGARFL